MTSGNNDDKPDRPSTRPSILPKKSDAIDPRAASYRRAEGEAEGTAADEKDDLKKILKEFVEDDDGTKKTALTDQEKALILFGLDPNKLVNLRSQLPENAQVVTIIYHEKDAAAFAELTKNHRDRMLPLCTDQIRPAEDKMRKETFLVPSKKTAEFLVAKAEAQKLPLSILAHEEPERMQIIRLQNKLLLFESGASASKKQTAPSPEGTDADTDADLTLPEAFPAHVPANRKIIKTLQAEKIPPPVPGTEGLFCSKLIIDLNSYFAYCKTRTDEERRDIEKEKEHLMATIGIELSSEYTQVNVDNHGMLEIINYYPHHGSTLGKFQNELAKITKSHLGMIEVSGRIAAAPKNPTDLIFEGSPTAAELTKWRDQNRAHQHNDGPMPFYSRHADLKNFAAGRGATSAQFYETAGPKIGELIPVTVSEEVIFDPNHPDAFISDDKLDAIVKKGRRALMNPKTALIEIRGAAGSGKSALMKQLAAQLPKGSVLEMRVDDGAAKVPGAALISLFSQLMAQIKAKFGTRIDYLKKLAENPPASYEMTEEEAHDLELAERVQAALDFDGYEKSVKHQQIETLPNLFLTALEIQAEKPGNFFVFIDDMHFLDSVSNPMMTKICTKAREKFGVTFVQGLRPEEREKYEERHSTSNHHRQMVAELRMNERIRHRIDDDSYDDQIVTTLNLQDENNNLILNLQDPQVAWKWAYYSIAEEKRNKAGVVGKPEPKELKDDWHLQVAKLFSMPYEMKYFYDEVKRRPEFFLTTSDDSPDIIMDMTRAKEVSVEIKFQLNDFLATKIRESKLSAHAEKLLQCIALVGDSLPIEKLLEFIGATDDGKEGPRTELFQKALIKRNIEGDMATGQHFQLLHSTLRTAVLRRTLNSDTRKNLAVELCTKFSDVLTPAMKLALLSEAATDRPLDDLEFWNDYDPVVEQVLKNAEKTELHVERLKIGLAGLGDLRAILNNKPTTSLGEAAQRMCDWTEDKPPVDAALQNIVINQLQGIADAGRYIGAFQEAYDAMDLLKKILNAYPKAADADGNPMEICPIDRLELGMRRIDTAFTQRNKPAMEACLNEDLDDLFAKITADMPLKKRALALITRYKYEITARDYKKADELAKANAALVEELEKRPLTAEGAEWVRIKCRMKVNSIINNIAQVDAQNIDLDIPVPEQFSEEDKEELRKNVKLLNELESKTSDLKLSPMQRRYIKDTRAGANRALGDLDVAIKEYSEGWSEGMECNDFPGASRASCEKAKIYATMAFTTKPGKPASPLDFDVQHVDKAIQILNDEGRQAAAEITEPTEIHKWNLHADRLRYIGMALLHGLKPIIEPEANPIIGWYYKPTRNDLKNEFQDYIQQAAESIVYIQEHFSKFATTGEGPDEGVYNYYHSSYCLMFLDICEYLKLTEIPLARPVNGRTTLNIEEMKTYAFFTEEARQRGIKYGATVREDELKEKERKFGLGLYGDLKTKLQQASSPASTIIYPDEPASGATEMAPETTVARAATEFANPEGNIATADTVPPTRRSED